MICDLALFRATQRIQRKNAEAEGADCYEQIMADGGEYLRHYRIGLEAGVVGTGGPPPRVLPCETDWHEKPAPPPRAPAQVLNFPIEISNARWAREYNRIAAARPTSAQLSFSWR